MYEKSGWAPRWTIMMAPCFCLINIPITFTDCAEMIIIFLQDIMYKNENMLCGGTCQGMYRGYLGTNMLHSPKDQTRLLANSTWNIFILIMMNEDTKSLGVHNKLMSPFCTIQPCALQSLSPAKKAICPAILHVSTHSLFCELAYCLTLRELLTCATIYTHLHLTLYQISSLHI